MRQALTYCGFAILVASCGVVAPAGAQQLASAADLNTAAAPSMRPDQIDIEGMTIESDFTVFMHRDVSPELRTKALRKLWKLMPQAPMDGHTAF